MEIGTFVSLKRFTVDIGELENYTCKIVDIDDEHFYIDLPIHQETRRTARFAVGETILAQYTKNGVAHEFRAKILERVNKNVPALKLKIPAEDEINRIQRREYVRVETDVDVAVHALDESFAPFTSVTKDLSGGGAKIYNPPETLEEKQKLQLYLVLPIQNQYEYIKTEAEVVRLHEENQVKTMSVKFLMDEEMNRQKIIQYCFHIQRRNRQLGLI